MIRFAPLALAALIAAMPAASQEFDVERVTLQPGQTASFTLAPGFDHQLLVAAEPTAKGAITVRYDVAGGQATVTATSRTGHATRFSVLADPDGNGGFQPAGDIDLPGDGSAVARSWPGTLGTINIGDFTGGPHGDHGHEASGG